MTTPQQQHRLGLRPAQHGDGGPGRHRPRRAGSRSSPAATPASAWRPSRALTGAGARVVVPARRPAARARRCSAGIERRRGRRARPRRPGQRRAPSRGRFLGSGRDARHPHQQRRRSWPAPRPASGPGWEAQFATNHLGHFALTNRLWPALAAGGGARVVGAVLDRPQALADPLRRRQLDAAATTSGRPTARPRRPTACSPCSSTRSRRDAGVRAFAAAPRRDPDPAAAAPAPRGDGRARLDRRGRQRSTPSASRRPSRARRPRCGRRPPRSSTAWAASTARTATSPSRPTWGRRPRARGASTRTRSTPTPPRACGRCRRELTGVDAFATA